jgi:very-short-patch-repair endonuclease
MQYAQYKNPPEYIRRAKELRITGPLCERLLWNALCELRNQTGLKFRRQQPLHPYIADFACMKARLVVELDGPSHDTRLAYDAKRNLDLQKMGWTVIRFTNEDVRDNLEAVIQAVINKAHELASGRAAARALP